jgi:hypothetical protein
MAAGGHGFSAGNAGFPQGMHPHFLFVLPKRKWGCIPPQSGIPLRLSGASRRAAASPTAFRLSALFCPGGQKFAQNFDHLTEMWNLPKF